MYSVPSRRRHKKEFKRLNLIPILDAVFIFIFFLLLSASFVKVFEINSNIPIISDDPPPPKSKLPLNLTLEIRSNRIDIFSGIPTKKINSIRRQAKEYDLEGLHNFLLQIKKDHKGERTIIFEPKVDLEYGALIKIMDAVRTFRTTDPAIYYKNPKTGGDIKLQQLFDDIVFGSIKG